MRTAPKTRSLRALGPCDLLQRSGCAKVRALLPLGRDDRFVAVRGADVTRGELEFEHERTGDVGNVVFPCGWVLLDDADTLRLYYGAADTAVCVATASLSALLAHLRRFGR